MQSHSFSRPNGFSLVEMSIVLAIIATILAGVLPFLTESTKLADTNETIERMEKIEDAIQAFYNANSRLPCPADNTKAINDALGEYGVESEPTGDCVDSAGLDANFEDTVSGIVGGGVPTKSINLPDEYGFDGWGRRFSYHVTQTLTSAINDGAIDINDHTANLRTDAAVYILISHGPNGHGAYTAAGTSRINNEVTNPSEQENCECDNSAAPGTYDDLFVQGMAQPDGTDPRNNFDDIVRYKVRSQITAP